MLGTPPPPPPPDVPGAQGDERRRHDRSRCASGWSSTARIRRARAATCGWIRSASRSRTSTRSASGAAPVKPARRSMRPARCRTAPSVEGVGGLRAVLRRVSSNEFVATVTEKLLTYALGRGVEYLDLPARPRDRARRRSATTIAGRRSFSASSRVSRFRCGGQNHDRSPRRRFRAARCCAVSGSRLALPLLDGMVPALTALARTPARPVRRFGVVYVPNGMVMKNWTPAAEGTAFELTPILQPLAAVPRSDARADRSRQQTAEPNARRGPGVHARASTRFLTGMPPRFTTGSRSAGRHLDGPDPRAASSGKTRSCASLELELESTESAGTCDLGYSCAYTNTIAWRSPTTPLPMENNPRAVFERLFGDSGTHRSRPRGWLRMQKDRSILDSVTEQGSPACSATSRRRRPRQAQPSISRRFATSSGASRTPRSRTRESCPSSISRPGVPAHASTSTRS